MEKLLRDYLRDISDKRKPSKLNRFKNYMGVYDKVAHPYFYYAISFAYSSV